MQERRTTDRSRTFLGGWVAYHDRRSTMDCVVRNLSEDGALLLFDEPMRVASDLELTVRHKGDSRRARVVWRSELGVGVAFLSADRGNVVPIEAARRLRSLEGERNALATRVAQLTSLM